MDGWHLLNNEPLFTLAAAVCKSPFVLLTALYIDTEASPNICLHYWNIVALETSLSKRDC
jgi:hypothetical protein